MLQSDTEGTQGPSFSASAKRIEGKTVAPKFTGGQEKKDKIVNLTKAGRGEKEAEGKSAGKPQTLWQE